MSTNADIGHGSQIAIWNGSSYDAIAEVNSIQPVGWSQDAIDVTHMASPNGYREYIPGLRNADPVTIAINYIPSASDAVIAAFDASSLKQYRITHPNNVTLTFSAIVTNYQPDVPVGDKMSATVTLQPSGKPVWA